MREVLVNDLGIAYSQAGVGPPLVLLHGGMDDSRSWRWQFDGLSDEFTVSAWDAPGCGRSSEPPETWRMARCGSSSGHCDADTSPGGQETLALRVSVFPPRGYSRQDQAWRTLSG